MKSVCLITKRNDLSRAAFRAYYETKHAILGMRYFPFGKYVRNHVIQDEGIDFDCLSEFWQGDTARAYDIMTSQTRDILRADEGKFMDQAKIRPAAAEEVLIAGRPRGVDREPVRRRILLLRRAKSATPDAFSDALIAFAKQAAKLRPETLRVTLDRTSALSAPTPFPYDALLSFWGEDPQRSFGVETPAEIELCGIVVADVCESPPDMLAAHFGKG